MENSIPKWHLLSWPTFRLLPDFWFYPVSAGLRDPASATRREWLSTCSSLPANGVSTYLCIQLSLWIALSLEHVWRLEKDLPGKKQLKKEIKRIKIYLSSNLNKYYMIERVRNCAILYKWSMLFSFRKWSDSCKGRCRCRCQRLCALLPPFYCFVWLYLWQVDKVYFNFSNAKGFL